MTALSFDRSRGEPPLHAVDECILKEAEQSQSRLRFALRVLQFLPDTQNIALHSGDGSWRYRPHLDATRTNGVKVIFTT
jgi:hypothetical protein